MTANRPGSGWQTVVGGELRLVCAVSKRDNARPQGERACRERQTNIRRKDSLTGDGHILVGGDAAARLDVAVGEKQILEPIGRDAAVAVGIKGNGLLLVHSLKDRALTDVAGFGIALGVVPAPFFKY